MVTNNNDNNSHDNNINQNHTRDRHWRHFIKIYIGTMYGRENLINFHNDYETLCEWWYTSNPLGFEILPHTPIALLLVLDGGYVIPTEIRRLLQDWKNRMHTNCTCIECRRIQIFQTCGFDYKHAMICVFHTTLYNIPVHSIITAWDSLNLLVNMIKPLNTDPIETNNFKIQIQIMLAEYQQNLYV